MEITSRVVALAAIAIFAGFSIGHASAATVSGVASGNDLFLGGGDSALVLPAGALNSFTISSATDLSPGTDSTVDGTRTPENAGEGYTYGYTFDLGAATPVIDINFGSLTGITGVALVSGIPSSTTSIDESLPTSKQTSYDDLDPGIYSVVVSGAIGNASPGVIGSISAVPLPGSFALFGSALLGLAGLASRHRRANA